MKILSYIGVFVWAGPILCAGYVWGSAYTYFRTGSMISQLGHIDAITAALNRSKIHG
jgi:hypothetical protein